MKTILDIIKANTEINRLNAEAEENGIKIEELKQAIEQIKSAHSVEIEKLKADHKTVLDAANGKIALLEEANQLLEEQQTSASEQAADIVAKQGVELPVEEAPEAEAKEDKNLDELWAEYNAMSDQKERRAFYIENIKPQL